MAEENKTDVAVHPHDEKPRFDISIPLTLDMFKVQPVDVLNLKLSAVIGNKFVAKRGTSEREREVATLTDEVTTEYFEGTRFIGLLFSAEWAAPCKTMLKLLRNFYSDINLDERLFEVILVPADQKKEQKIEHFSTMPWTSLPFGDARIQQFMKRYEVTGVPKLIIIDSKTGFKITDTARKDLNLAQQEDVGVQGVWKSWLKLHEINKVKGVKRAQEDAIAAT